MTPKYDDITRARVQLLNASPFFGMLCLRLRLKADETLNPPTAAVDGVTLSYHPNFIATLSLPKIQTVLAHEVLHCVMEHISRRGDRDPKRWNYACDYAINLLLVESRFEAIDGWLLDKKYVGMSADEIYPLLPADLPQTKFVCEIQQGAKPGEDGEGGGGEAQTSAARSGWRVAVAQAAMTAQQAGNLPGCMKRFVDQMLEPQVDWRDQLRRLMTETSKDDYSWARPNRRHVGAGMYLPSLHSQSAGAIWTVIDTSGSITDKMLQIFGSEISAIKTSVQPSSVEVVYCDAAVAHTDHFDQYDDLSFEMHGGGGTDFRPPFKLVEERDVRPACLVYLTDGYGPFPDEPPSYPVIWCMTTDVVPPWGDMVRVTV